MGKRISHSVLDPYLSIPIKARYDWFPIPKQLPPEAIVVTGHLLALAGAVGFAYSTVYWWGGLLAAFGVIFSHIADLLDGTHARRTGQCRNGGELLDHFLDPLSFSYLLIGLCLSCGRWDLAVAAVLCLYATAVLTNIKAKLIGEFTLVALEKAAWVMVFVQYAKAKSFDKRNPEALPQFFPRGKLRPIGQTAEAFPTRLIFPTPIYCGNVRHGRGLFSR